MPDWPDSLISWRETVTNWSLVGTSIQAVRVRIRFERRWASYVEERTWHPSQTLARAPGGSVELSMDVGGTAELRSWVLSFGSGAEVLEPERLRREVVRELEESLGRYGARRTAPASRAGSDRQSSSRAPSSGARFAR